tara:strand:+ start:241667 stop:241852 length:186 start_codon:yes stop_codon:yes gene_type:complete
MVVRVNSHSRTATSIIVTLGLISEGKVEENRKISMSGCDESLYFNRLEMGLGALINPENQR